MRDRRLRHAEAVVRRQRLPLSAEQREWAARQERRKRRPPDEGSAEVVPRGTPDAPAPAGAVLEEA